MYDIEREVAMRTRSLLEVAEAIRMERQLRAVSVDMAAPAAEPATGSVGAHQLAANPGPSPVHDCSAPERRSHPRPA